MKRTARDNRPNIKPVERVELSEKHINVRLVILISSLAVAIGALVFALVGLLNGESGWREIKVNQGTEMNCSSEFIFQYDLGRSGATASAEYKKLAAIYSEITVRAYRIFNSRDLFDNVANPKYISGHPNEIITVEPILYRAFETVKNAGAREIYLGPVYEDYDALFSSDTDGQARESDPNCNTGLAEECKKIAEFASSPEDIELELLGENKIRLNVSETYQKYLDEVNASVLIDFAYMKNAFIIDWLAEEISENGFANGSITSYDGYVRNLDPSGTQYGFNIFAKSGDAVYLAGTMLYSQPTAIVSLHAYPLNESLDQYIMYRYEDGTVRTQFIDRTDGLDRTSEDQLIGYLYGGTCTDVLMKMLGSYVGQEPDHETLTKNGMQIVYVEGNVIRHSEKELGIGNLFDDGKVKFSSSAD